MKKMYIAELEHSSASKRIPICSGIFQDSVYKTVSKWPIDFNDYFEFCRTKNTRANHP